MSAEIANGIATAQCLFTQMPNALIKEQLRNAETTYKFRNLGSIASCNEEGFVLKTNPKTDSGVLNCFLSGKISYLSAKSKE